MGERHQFILLKGINGDDSIRILEQCTASSQSDLIERQSAGEPTVQVADGEDCATILIDYWEREFNAIGGLHAGPWITIRAQEGDHWDYTLHHGKSVIDEFSVKPNYWDGDEPYDSKYDCKKGNPSILAVAWNIPVKRIERYLLNWEQYPDEDARIARVKAYPGDNATHGDVFQVNDFARALGARFGKDIYRKFHIHPGSRWRP